VQSGHHLIDCKLFSQWYSWKCSFGVKQQSLIHSRWGRLW